MTKSTPAKAAHINPKATPQVPKGAVPSQQPTMSSKLSTWLPTTKPPMPSASNSGGNFQIPKGGDKRARDPSQGSKISVQSIIPPPTKQQKTYATAAAKSHAHNAHDHQWPDLQLRVYKDTIYHEPISYDNFTEVRERMMGHSLAFLEKHPDKGYYLQVTSTYYNKLIHCGVYNFANIHALNWFKRELPKACFQAYRGWTNDEQVTTFVKIFVPQGFEKLLAHDYLKASRLMFKTQNAPDIPWGLINESFHPKKHTRQIIASIPTATLQVIQARGAETSEGSGVWKADGFLAPFKVTVASASDMQNANTANNPDQNMEQGMEEEVQIEDTEATTVSPPVTLTCSQPSASPKSSPPPLGPELTPSKFPELINNPLLSDAANDNTEATSKAEGQEGDKDNMDFQLLDDDVGRAWADQI
jgi:hypothetical protein